MERPNGSLLVWGAGGHAAVVVDVLRAAGHRLAGFVDIEPARLERARSEWGVDILLLETDLMDAVARDDRLPAGASGLALGVGGDNRLRHAFLRRVPSLPLPTLVHPSAVVSPLARVGRGTVVMPGAVVNSRARVGAGVIINTGAIVEHDCVVEDGAHVGPGSTLGGRVSVGERALVGAGAVILPGTAIAADAAVGAGAVVVRDVAPGSTVVGNPAREIRERSER